jgi:acyl carrier protein
VGIGVAGELYAGGEGVARGYFKRPALTAEKFVPDPFSGQAGSRLYRTGDRARWLPDGSLEFLGRIDDQVKVRGFRIEPAEIEDALGRHEGVAMCAVVSRQDNLGQNQLVAYYVGNTPEIPPEPNELRLYLRRKLPEYMVPSRFIPMYELPFTTSGKIDRKALPQPEFPAQAHSASPHSDLTSTESALVGIWSEVLGVEMIDLDDNFFDLGGHSLMATQILSRTCARLRVDLPLSVFFEFPTIRRLAVAIDDRKKAGAEAVEPRAPLVSSEDRELEALIEQVAGLSEEEVQSILAKKDS